MIVDGEYLRSALANFPRQPEPQRLPVADDPTVTISEFLHGDGWIMRPSAGGRGSASPTHGIRDFAARDRHHRKFSLRKWRRLRGAGHRLFSATATGLCVQLLNWSYPVVANLATGQVQYDNYNGQWGEQKHLDAFLQAYAVEKAKIEARKRGHSVSETRLQDGSIKVTVRVGGAA